MKTYIIRIGGLVPTYYIKHESGLGWNFSCFENEATLFTKEEAEKELPAIAYLSPSIRVSVQEEAPFAYPGEEDECFHEDTPSISNTFNGSPTDY